MDVNATRCTVSSMSRATLAECASSSRRARSAITLNTGSISVGEPLIARKISPVAVCCSSVSDSSVFLASSSVNSRTFSMAMTAWSAKV